MFEIEELEELIDDLQQACVEEPQIVGSYKDSMGYENAVYCVEYDDKKIQMINSSNQEILSEFGHIYEAIADELEDDTQEGEVYDSYSGNQIWFEVVGIDDKGTLIK